MYGLEKPVQVHESNTDLEFGESTRKRVTTRVWKRRKAHHKGEKPAQPDDCDGISITSKDLAWRCIRILLLKYDGLVTTLNTQNRNPPEDFNAMLLEEEMHQNTRNGEDSTFSAWTKKGKGKDSSNPSSSDNKKKKMIKYIYHNKLGHKQNECWKKLANKKNNIKRESGNSAQEVPIELFVAIEEICTKAG